MENINETEISKAIENTDFDKFISLIFKISSSYRRYQLTMEAITVARFQKNIHALKQFVEIEFDHWDTRKLFQKIIEVLVELNAEDTLFGIIIRNENKKLNPGEGWYLLAKALLTKKKLN